MINRRRLRRRLAPAFILGGAAVGSSLIASNLPGNTGQGLQNASTGFANFSGVAANVGGAVLTIDILNQLAKKKRRKRR
jgi:hypothetical protein